MGITFKKLDNSYKTEIYKDNLHVGHVDYDIFSNRWTLHPSFSVPYTLNSAKDDKYFSSYEAGKGLIKMYELCYPGNEEEYDDQYLGMDLEDILIYLKTRD